jgi:DNA-binding CsgD family transcriptional regulator
MRTWKLDGSASESGQVQNALANIVSSIGHDAFSSLLLYHLNRLMPIGCWSIYEIGNDKPVMFDSGSYQRTDTTRRSWAEYLSGPYLYDQSFSAARGVDLCPVVAHVTAQELTSPGHRERVYDQFDMTERVSIAEGDTSGSVLALNLYRYKGQSSFSDRDFGMLEMLAVPLLAVTKRHIALNGLKRGPKSPVNAGSFVAVDTFRGALAADRADFSERELDVCARLLIGMSYDGIAADLNLSVSTVKTYRNRAFARLGISFKSELVRHYLTCTASKT